MYRLAFLLLAAGALLFADVNEDLLNAARSGDLDAVKALVEKGASIEVKTAYGQTPLYLAAMSGRDSVVQFLLDKGAKTDITDTFYKASMLDFVLERKHYAIAKILIARGDGKIDNELKETADSGQADLVQAVLAKGKPSQPALDAVYESALTEKRSGIAESLKKAGANEPAPPFVVDPKVLESYAGTFKSEQFPLDIKSFVKEGKLYIQATGQDAFSLKPKSATVFTFAPANIEIDFDTPASFTLKQGSMNIKFKKAVTQ